MTVKRQEHATREWGARASRMRHACQATQFVGACVRFPFFESSWL